jgi:hypothetical protein
MEMLHFYFCSTIIILSSELDPGQAKLGVHVDRQMTHKELGSFTPSESVLDGFSIERDNSGLTPQSCDSHTGQQGEAFLSRKVLHGEQSGYTINTMHVN